jgi:peptidoglycan/LPS O-acetylase OafA/YrhL
LIARLGHFQSAILDVTWSLAVEEQFYLLWPALVFLLSKEKIKKLAIILFVLAFFIRVAFYWGGVVPMKSYVLLPCRLDSLSVGAFLACSDLKFTFSLLRRVTGVFLGASFFVFLFGFSAADILMRTFGYSINAILSGAIISFLLIQEPSFLQKIFQKRILRFCGKHSYAMYLFHVPIVHLLLRWGQGFWTLASTSPTKSFIFQIFFHSLSLIATLVLSFVLYHAFEKHFLKLKNLFSYSPDSTSPSPLSQSSSLN